MSPRPPLQGARVRSADASRSRAAARPVPLGSGLGRRRTDSPADQLERMSAELDELIAEENLGPATSHRAFEARVAKAERIGAGIRAAYRSATSPQPSAAPAWQQGGKAIW